MEHNNLPYKWVKIVINSIKKVMGLAGESMSLIKEITIKQENSSNSLKLTNVQKTFKSEVVFLKGQQL